MNAICINTDISPFKKTIYANANEAQYDSCDLSRSLPCTVPYRSYAQWRIANAVKVTHVRQAGNASSTSPLVLSQVPAGHVARFSPPSLHLSSRDRGNDLSP